MLPSSRTSLLFSYAYIRDSARAGMLWRSLAPHVQLLIDSGAFTDYHATRKALAAGVKHSPITIKEYISACRNFDAAKIDGYIQLDKLMDEAQSRKNLAIMRDAGLDPIPVITIKEPPEAAVELAGKTDRLCVAGGGLSKHGQVGRYNMVARAAIKAGRPLLLHGLGFADWRHFFHARLYSGDISTYVNGSKFGRHGYFDQVKGLVTTGPETASRFNASKDPVYQRFRTYFMRCGFDRDVLARKDTYTGQRTPAVMTTVHAYLLYQAFCEKKGRQLYFAINDGVWTAMIAAVRSDSRPDGTFDQKIALSEYDRVHGHYKATKTYAELATSFSRPPGHAL